MGWALGPVLHPLPLHLLGHLCWKGTSRGKGSSDSQPRVLCPLDAQSRRAEAGPALCGLWLSSAALGQLVGPAFPMINAICGRPSARTGETRRVQETPFAPNPLWKRPWESEAARDVGWSCSLLVSFSAQLFENSHPRSTSQMLLPARRRQRGAGGGEKHGTFPDVPGLPFEMRSKCWENMSDVPGPETSSRLETTKERR